MLALTLGTLATASEYRTLYSSPEERAAAVRSMGSPAALAMTGPGRYLSDYTAGAMLGHQLLGFTAVLVGLMSVLTVTRHTRDEEETGRAELVRSAVVGRHAHLAAALGVAAVANLVLAVPLALGLTTAGIEGVDSRRRAAVRPRAHRGRSRLRRGRRDHRPDHGAHPGRLRRGARGDRRRLRAAGRR